MSDATPGTTPEMTDDDWREIRASVRQAVARGDAQAALVALKVAAIRRTPDAATE